jgi:formate--tetrahydrofolate ligase
MTMSPTTAPTVAPRPTRPAPQVPPQPTARPIEEIAARLGLTPLECEPYGRGKAKIGLDALERRAEAPDGKLVCVTSITPTAGGEGKTTTAIALADGLARIGADTVLCLREPSIGPVFGIKGGGTGGGRAQVTPAADVNLHFTGDLHAIGAANNLLAAMIDASILHGNPLDIDPARVTWRRCLDVNDRALRSIVTGLGGPKNGWPRETGFDITAASEVMAIVAVARDAPDLRRRLGAITVAETFDGEPVTAEQLNAAGSMAALLADAFKPNLVQTLEGVPALVHTGPFANIAHGNNSLVADRLARKLGDYVVTEAGFGADMGFEKFVDIVCRLGGFAPSAVVLVATVRALKQHGGAAGGGVEAIRRGAGNLRRHIDIVRGFGLDPVVTLNRFPDDTAAELEAVRELVLQSGASGAAICAGFEEGGAGAEALADAVVEAAERRPVARPAYSLDAPLTEKLEAVATRVYGADGVALAPEARADVEALEARGLGSLPICMAKTPLSLGHDTALGPTPTHFRIPVRRLRAYTGAGWIVALLGDVMTMPGLGASPAAHRIDVAADGTPTGLR